MLAVNILVHMKKQSAKIKNYIVIVVKIVKENAYRKFNHICEL